MRPFHLAFPVTDLNLTKSFYVDVLQCGVGRTSDRWIDFDMFGHQVVAHLVDDKEGIDTNPVDGDNVPASHFAYNAMAICTERGIMEVDMMTNRFNPTGDVTGADALLIIRNLQTSLRMTF